MNSDVTATMFILIVMTLVASYFWLRPHRRINAVENSSNIYTSAILVKKIREIHRGKYGPVYIFLLVFNLQDHTQRTFRVNSDVYSMYREGDKGALTYKELNDIRIFVSFQRTK